MSRVIKLTHNTENKPVYIMTDSIIMFNQNHYNIENEEGTKDYVTTLVIKFPTGSGMRRHCTDVKETPEEIMRMIENGVIKLTDMQDETVYIMTNYIVMFDQYGSKNVGKAEEDRITTLIMKFPIGFGMEKYLKYVKETPEEIMKIIESC